MAKIFPIIVKKIENIIGGGAGFIASVIKQGFNLTNQIRLILGEVKIGTESRAENFDLESESVPQNMAAEISLIGAVGESTVNNNPAPAAVPSLRGITPDSCQQNPAFDSDSFLRAVAPQSAPQNPAFSAQASLRQSGANTQQNPAIAEGMAPGSLQSDSIPLLPSLDSESSLRAVGSASTPQKSAVHSALLSVQGSAAYMQLNGALMETLVIKESKTLENPAFELVQIKVDLNHRSGSNSVTEANGACGRADFDTPANAQGLHNGTLCACAGNLLAARCGRLNLAFADFTNKSSLTISQVWLHFYYKQASILAATSTGGYNFGGSDTQLFSNAALSNPDYTSSPQSFDITSAISSWTDLNNLRAYMIAEIAALALNDSVSVDAVELEIIATRTDNP